MYLIMQRLISNLVTDKGAKTRVEQCEFYRSGQLSTHFNSGSYVYQGGENIGNIGYWNIFYDQAGSEGFQYATDAGGYSSNAINMNAANGIIRTGEFASGSKFKTLSTGYSSLFTALYQECIEAAQNRDNAKFELIKNTRLHSIWHDNSSARKTRFRLSTRYHPERAIGEEYSTDYAFMAMPPNAIDLVASATRYLTMSSRKIDFLNETNVQNYLQSVIEQPSYKVGMFFKEKWWGDMGVGKAITDLPLRQVYYFGDNASGSISKEDKVYGLLASYDDMRFTDFWEVLQLPVDERQETPRSRNYQPLEGPRKPSFQMIRMLKLQLAKVHYADPDKASLIPDPAETVFMNWGLNPFGAGYHAWASHYDICDVMQNIRTPGRMAGANDSNVFIIGSAFSNDQGWVEGAFCTAESVLIDYLGISTIAENTENYPLICGSSTACENC